MKGMLSWVAAAALLAGPAAHVQAQEETVFRPSGNWTADYGDDYCRLIRNFTDGTREFSLALERLQPGAQVRLIVVGEGMRPFRGAEQIAYQFLPAGSSGKRTFWPTRPRCVSRIVRPFWYARSTCPGSSPAAEPRLMTTT